MTTAIQINLVDRSNERTSTRIPVAPLTPANTAVLQAFATEFEAAIEPLTFLHTTGTSLNETTRQSYTLPDDISANREIAVRFVMADENMNQASFSIGGPTLDAFPFTTGEGGDVFVWGSAAVGTPLNAFVTDVLAIARHPVSGLAMTMVRLELIGRSN